MKNSLLFLSLLLLLMGCKQNAEKPQGREGTAASSGYYKEPYRLQYHFTPEAKWMNDPNGLVYHKGRYHLFYQYYPEDIVWGPMHWGHASSTDLIHWEHLPIALYPDELGLIFSGSAVVDIQNTSGFGSIQNPPLVAVFTYHNMEKEKAGRLDYQTQGIAYSLDDGYTWTKYEGNPVIGNIDIKDFRDPKVFWHDATKQWILTLVAGDHAKFYASPNLKDWTWLSDFGKEQGAHGGVWECPDLFPLTIAETGEQKWVLLISINPGAPNGGSGTQYFVGDFDGKSFVSEQEETKWLDYGRDNYAGVTYNDTPNGDRIFIGWMSNWDYARDTPTDVWRSSMTLPRDLTLHVDDGAYFVRSTPVAQVNDLIESVETLPEFELNESFAYTAASLMQSEIQISVQMDKKLEIRLGSDTEYVSLQFHPEKGDLVFDRRNSGKVNFEPSFAPAVQKQPYAPRDTKCDLRIFMDASSIEVFIDKGRYIFSNQIFPNQPYTTLSLHGELQNMGPIQLKRLKRIWNEQ